jgi:hypothetical protein
MDPKNRLFKDFVVSPIDFNDPTDTPLESQTITEESAPDEDVVVTQPIIEQVGEVKEEETLEEKPDQNAPEGLPGIDRSIDSCS